MVFTWLKQIGVGCGVVPSPTWRENKKIKRRRHQIEFFGIEFFKVRYVRIKSRERLRKTSGHKGQDAPENPAQEVWFLVLRSSQNKTCPDL